MTKPKSPKKRASRRRGIGTLNTSPPPLMAVLLDFGAPALNDFEPRAPLERRKVAMGFVIKTWNALVLADSQWGEPKALADLQGAVERAQVNARLGELFGLLCSRRREPRFSKDLRLVVAWEIAPSPDKIFAPAHFTCEGADPPAKN